MSKKKKSDDQTTSAVEPAKAEKPQPQVYVTYFGLEPSPLQRKGLADRGAGLKASLLNGWVQDGKSPYGRLTQIDIDLRSARGKDATAEADRQAAEHVKAYEAHTLPPLVTGGRNDSVITVRGGVSAITPEQWSDLQVNKVLIKSKTIGSGRLLGPDKTADLASTKDQTILVDLVRRTHCPDGLAWLHRREVTRKNSRASVLSACAAKAKRMGVELKD